MKEMVTLQPQSGDLRRRSLLLRRVGQDDDRAVQHRAGDGAARRRHETPAGQRGGSLLPATLVRRRRDDAPDLGGRNTPSRRRLRPGRLGRPRRAQEATRTTGPVARKTKVAVPYKEFVRPYASDTLSANASTLNDIHVQFVRT